MGRRAQAAMEFMMTYGWVLLIILVAIAALAFFGVLNPQRLLPSTCTLGIGFSCDDFKVSSNTASNNIEIAVRNGIGTTLDFFAIYVDPDAIECDGRYAYTAFPFTPTTSPPFFEDTGPFIDGAARPLRTYTGPNSTIDKVGIKCFSTTGFGGFDNCCSAIEAGYAAVGHPGMGCSAAATCDDVFTPPRASKFKADIIVKYRELGSSLTHSRIGQIIAQVE